MARNKAPERSPRIVREGSVKITVRPWTHPSGREYWRYSYHAQDGTVKDVTRADLDDALQLAKAKAREIHNGIVDLTQLPQDKIRMIRAFLELNPTWSDLERWGADRHAAQITVEQAINRFYKFKVAESADGETKHLKLTKADLLSMAEAVGKDNQLQVIRAAVLAEWLDELDVGGKRKRDYRAACVALWNWARKQELIHVQGKYAEPEKLPMPPLAKKDHVRVLSVEELQFLFQHVTPKFLPWLALSAFSGLRSGEIRQWGKDPLDWSMIKLDRRIIDLPPSIAKTRRRKLIPISETLAAWLQHCGPQESGIVIPEPAYESETGRLGGLMNKHFHRTEGWPTNCLRHSFGSHRVAETKDIAAVALEMDNSPKMIKNHYLEARTTEEATAYFAVLPGTLPEQNHK